MFKSLIVGAEKRNDNRGKRSGRDVLNGLGYSKFKNKKSVLKKKCGPQVCFYIGKNLMKQARFIGGDRLDLLYDEESQRGLLKRMPSDSDFGNKISGGKQKGGGNGNCSPFQISAFYGNFPDTEHVINLDNVIVNNEGILFDWPKG
jgi:hypothetical protein